MAVDHDHITSRLIYDDKIFCTTLFTETPLHLSDKTAGKSFYVLQFEWPPESSSAVTLLPHANWMMLKNASNQGGANSVTVLSARNPSRRCWSLRKLHFSKIIWQLALEFSIDLRLNATRRSINLSVCLVFDLEARQFKFLGENLLGTGVLENELSTLVSFL